MYNQIILRSPKVFNPDSNRNQNIIGLLLSYRIRCDQIGRYYSYGLICKLNHNLHIETKGNISITVIGHILALRSYLISLLRSYHPYYRKITIMLGNGAEFFVPLNFSLPLMNLISHAALVYI